MTQKEETSLDEFYAGIIDTIQTCLMKFAIQHYLFFEIGFSWLKPESIDLNGIAEALNLETNKFIEDFNNITGNMRGEFGKSSWKLMPSEEFNPEYVKYHAMRRALTDLDTLYSIFAQRTKYIQLDFIRGDIVANQWIQYAYDLFSLKTDIQSITFMRTSTKIRIAPYVDIAFIGLPPSIAILEETESMLTIPHEVGHYVYWNGRAGEGRVRSMIENILDQQIAPPYLYDWAEEIFSDVFACVTAGPIVAYHMQKHLKRLSRTQMIADDHQYPLAILRPRIFHYVLSCLDYSSTVRTLEQEWENTKKALRLNQRKRNLSGASLSKIEHKMIAFVEALCNEVFKLTCGKQRRAPWEGKIDSDTNESSFDNLSYDDLLKRFEDTVEKWEQDKLQDDSKLLRNFNWFKWFVDILFSPFSPEEHEEENIDPSHLSLTVNCSTNWRSWIQELVDDYDTEIKAKIEADLPIDIDVWMKVLQADGWTTEGPHSLPDGP